MTPSCHLYEKLLALIFIISLLTSCKISGISNGFYNETESRYNTFDGKSELSEQIIRTYRKEDSRTIHIKAIGWQFRLPSGTILKDSTFNNSGELTGTIPSEGPSLRLFVIKDSTLGTFSAYVRKDTLDSASWRKWHDSDTKWYFEQMQQLSKCTVLKTGYSTQKVSGIDFLVQYVKFIRKDNSDTGYIYHCFGRIIDNEIFISGKARYAFCKNLYAWGG